MYGDFFVDRVFASRDLISEIVAVLSVDYGDPRLVLV